MRKLTGIEKEEFNEVLRGAFDENELDRFLRLRLNLRLSDVTSPGNFTQVVFELIEKSERDGFTEKLMQEAINLKPNNQALSDFVNKFGIYFSLSSSPNPPGQTSTPSTKLKIHQYFAPFEGIDHLILPDDYQAKLLSFLEDRKTNSQRNPHIFHLHNGVKGAGKTSLASIFAHITHKLGYGPIYLGNLGQRINFNLNNETWLKTALYLFNYCKDKFSSEEEMKYYFGNLDQLFQEQRFQPENIGNIFTGMQKLVSNSDLKGIICFFDFEGDNIIDQRGYIDTWSSFLEFSVIKRLSRDHWPDILFVVLSSGKAKWEDDRGVRWSLRQEKFQEWELDDFIELCRLRKITIKGTPPDINNELYITTFSFIEEKWPVNIEGEIKRLS